MRCVERVLLSMMVLLVQACGHGTPTVAAEASRRPVAECTSEHHGCFIESMLKRQDYSLASHAQLNLAAKLIEQQPRLMAE